MKRGKLSKADIELIRTSGKSVEELSKELDRSPETIRKYVTTTTPNNNHFNRVIGKHKRGESDQVVATVMTEAASEITDSKRKSFQHRYSNNIHKPLGDR